jgi:hypothetical protein
MCLESGGILSFRMNQVAFFRKNYVASDEWIPSPFLEIDDPTLDSFITDPVEDGSFQGSPATPVDVGEPTGGIAVDPTGDVDQSLVLSPVEDRRGFRVSPPQGFLDLEKPDGPFVRRFYDPVTQGRLDVVDLGATKEAIEAIKNRISRAHARNATSGLKVLQDQKVVDTPYQGWYFEFQEDVDGTTVRRIWLFARGSRKAFILKYSSLEKHFNEFSRRFAESIRSFSTTESEAVESASAPPTTGTEPEKPPRKRDPASELLRLLNSKRDREASRKAIDEYLKQDEDGVR